MTEEIFNELLLLGVSNWGECHIKKIQSNFALDFYVTNFIYLKAFLF